MNEVVSINKSFSRARALMKLYALLERKVNRELNSPKFSAKKFIALSNEYSDLYGQIVGLIADGIRDQNRCHVCDGDGRMPIDSVVCPKCGGSGKR